MPPDLRSQGHKKLWARPESAQTDGQTDTRDTVLSLTLAYCIWHMTDRRSIPIYPSVILKVGQNLLKSEERSLQWRREII